MLSKYRRMADLLAALACLNIACALSEGRIQGLACMQPPIPSSHTTASGMKDLQCTCFVHCSGMQPPKECCSSEFSTSLEEVTTKKYSNKNITTHL